MMNKILLKRLLYEKIEDLARLDSQVQQLEASVKPDVMPLVRALKGEVAQAVSTIWAQSGVVSQLYQEEPLDTAVINKLFESLVRPLQTRMQPLWETVYRLQPPEIPTELDALIGSLALDKLLPGAPSLVFLPTDGRVSELPAFLPQDLRVEPLPFPALVSPLRWLDVLDNFVGHFASHTLQISAVTEEWRFPEPREALVTPLLALRLLGPAYYAQYVLKAFLNDDAVALWAVEPLLFQALNRFGLVNKDFVILHQSVEKGRQNGRLSEPKGTAKLLAQDEVRDSLLQLAERVIPDRLAFTEKSFIRTQLLEDRLSSGTMISAVPSLTSIAQLRDDLAELPVRESIYGLLHQMRETPASPLEIINAGWLTKLDGAPDRVEAVLHLPVAEAWPELRRHVLALDALLMRSIEISEVHRVLSHEDVDTPLAI